MTLSVDDLVEGFAACRLPKGAWTHSAHLTVGLWHVGRYGPDEALARLRRGIARLNESFGNVNTPASGYHETITCAYVQLLAAFLDRCPAEMTFDQRVEQLLGGPLAGKDVLLRFYRPETLASSRARLAWIEPDVAPLRISDVLTAL